MTFFQRYFGYGHLDATECREVNLERRTAADGTATYHAISFPSATGARAEKIYDSNQRLIKIILTGSSSHSETIFDPKTGQRIRVHEIARHPDGNTIATEVVYASAERCSQLVTITAQDGTLVRMIERRHNGWRTTYHEQTDYLSDGTPATTVYQFMEEESGQLVHREQVYWQAGGVRAMTEHFHFDCLGRTVRYAKIMHHPNSTPFSEETQDFSPSTGKMIRREITTYNMKGIQTCLDVTYYSDDGQLQDRLSTIFDKAGRPIATRATGHRS